MLNNFDHKTHKVCLTNLSAALDFPKKCYSSYLNNLPNPAYVHKKNMVAPEMP